MVAQAVRLGVVAALGVLCGWMIGRGVPSTTSAAPTAASNFAAPAGTPEDCICGEERARLLGAVQRARQVAIAGGPSWPADPGDHAPQVVEASLKAAIEACGEDADLLELDCTEPPCIGVVRVGENAWNETSMIAACEPWHEKYGEEAAISMKSIVCDGTPYNVAFFSPTWPQDLTPSISPEQHQKRLGERMKTHRKISCP